ncbi:MAG: ABC transporter substrate-binding protein [Desulfovibrio sp.]|jgi:simple sugar transport system substrate-binding protein|nr:ABC transporter substrate-binding protein [Desulfovibrio sp.]
MNKATLFFRIAFLVLTLASCSENDTGKKKEMTRNATNLVVVGFSQVGAESDWRRANTMSMKETFTEEKGYGLLFRDAQQKQSNQIVAIREFIQKKVDYIVLAPVTEQGWDEVLRDAKAAGIPVIVVDRMIQTSDDELYTCWVGSDFRKEGDTAVLWMEKTFRDKETLTIAHMQGSLGSSAQIGRTEGLHAGASRNAGWKIVLSDTGDFTQVRGKEVMERFLSEFREIDVLYCENDNMAFGAMQAMENAHIQYGSNGGVTIISFDATHAGLEATRAGKISFNVECNPLHGPRVEKIIRQMLNGETPNKISYVDEIAFDAATITQEAIDRRGY